MMLMRLEPISSSFCNRSGTHRWHWTMTQHWLFGPEAETPHHPQNQVRYRVHDPSSSPLWVSSHAPLTIASNWPGSVLPYDMPSLSIFRVASRAVRPASFARAPIVQSRVQTPAILAARSRNFGTTSKLLSGLEDETYEEFSARYDFTRMPLALAKAAGRMGGRAWTAASSSAS